MVKTDKKLPKFVTAEPGPKHSVIYTDSENKRWKFEGGTRAWRNQNPGNLVSGKVSKRNGAIGKAGGFAVFQGYEVGHVALIDSLKNEHGDKDIERLMYVFAPPKENKTKRYISFLCRRTGVKGNKRIRDFTKDEFEKLWRAIEQMEGWGKTGKITEITSKAQITGIRKDKKGTIRAYQIEGYGWVSKKEGIDLTLQGKVDAVVATSPRGNAFLRARPNQETSDNLEAKA